MKYLSYPNMDYVDKMGQYTVLLNWNWCGICHSFGPSYWLGKSNSILCCVWNEIWNLLQALCKVHISRLYIKRTWSIYLLKWIHSFLASNTLFLSSTKQARDSVVVVVNLSILSNHWKKKVQRYVCHSIKMMVYKIMTSLEISLGNQIQFLECEKWTANLKNQNTWSTDLSTLAILGAPTRNNYMLT